MGRYSNPDNVTRLQAILAGDSRDRPPGRTTRSHQEQHRLNPDEIRELLARYASGMTINDLAAEFNISRTTVMEQAQRAGAVYDVARHPSPMSRDTTWWRGQDLNLRPSGYEFRNPAP